MATPLTDLHCQYAFASGRSHTDCVFIGRRWRDEYGTNLSDSDFWVLVNMPNPEPGVPSRTFTRWRWRNIITGIWRSLATGTVYVSDASLPAVHVYRDVMDQARDREHHRLRFAPEGVWGLDDANVFAWGTGKNAAGQLEYPVAKFDGQQWQDLPNPGFPISKLHGLAPDFLYAAGRGGGMARWDGRAWTIVPVPTDEVFSDVFVAGPDEIYATGHRGSLLQGSSTSWRLITRTVDERLPYACVAKWHDDLYVGGGPLGLFRRVGTTDQLELYKPKVKATSFDARESLIATTDHAITGTVDGQSFRGSAINALHDLTNTQDIEE